jgi:hypothetical protein
MMAEDFEKDYCASEWSVMDVDVLGSIRLNLVVIWSRRLNQPKYPCNFSSIRGKKSGM